jgi:SCY1-like protein 2
MTVIRQLGDRVEKEHNQFLRDSQRLEDRSATAMDDALSGPSLGGTVDFESLVGRANGATVKADTVAENSTSWEDDVWGSILTNDTNEVCTSLSSMTCCGMNFL